MHDDQGLGTSFFEGHRGDGPIFATFVIRPDEAGVQHHFIVPTEERHGLRGGRVAEHQTVRAPIAGVVLHYELALQRLELLARQVWLK